MSDNVQLGRQGVDFNETFAPVVRGPTLRFQLADAVRRGLTLDQIDFEAAFLQSPIDGDVYLRAPAGTKVPRGYVLKLKKECTASSKPLSYGTGQVSGDTKGF